MPTKQNFNDQATFNSLRCTAKLVIKEGQEIPVRIVRRGLHADEVTVERAGVTVRSLRLRGESCRIVPEDPDLRRKMPEQGSVLLYRAHFGLLKDITVLDGGVGGADGLGGLEALSIFADLPEAEPASGDIRPTPKASGKRRKGQEPSDEAAGSESLGFSQVF